MQHFQCDGQFPRLLVVAAQQPGHEYNKQGAKAFAAGLENVAGHRTGGFRQAFHGASQRAVDAGQFQGKARFQGDGCGHSFT